MAKMNAEHLVDLALAFQKSRVFLTACELGVFTAINKAAKSSHEVASELGTAERHTDRLMNALCGLGLLKKRGRQFRNTSLALKYLVRTSPYYMGSVMHYVNMWDTWSALTPVIRHGRSMVKKGLNDRGKKWLKPFIATMHERGRRDAASVAKMIDLSGDLKVLDVGGGSGAYAMAFVKAYRGITATVFDLPNVVPLTKKYIREEGLSDKIKVVVGDFNTDALGNGFDAVFLSAIIHMNSPGENRALLRKAACALRSPGQIIIQDFIMDEDRVNPPFGAFFALNMLAVTRSGDTYTESEVRAWLEEAGFEKIARKDTGTGTSLIMGRKRTGMTRSSLKRNEERAR
jgi:ubiquinone/menaquinone biosynthesis C-methylase UbiE